MTYEIIKSYNDYYMLVKAAKIDQYPKLSKVQKDTNQLQWFKSTDTFWNAFIGHCGAPWYTN